MFLLFKIKIVVVLKYVYFGACPEGIATSLRGILIIYTNCIIPNLGEYILKILLKSVDNCKS